MTGTTTGTFARGRGNMTSTDVEAALGAVVEKVSQAFAPGAAGFGLLVTVNGTTSVTWSAERCRITADERVAYAKALRAELDRVLSMPGVVGL